MLGISSLKWYILLSTREYLVNKSMTIFMEWKLRMARGSVVKKVTFKVFLLHQKIVFALLLMSHKSCTTVLHRETREMGHQLAPARFLDFQ